MNNERDNSKEHDDRLRIWINKVAELAGGATGSAVGTVIGSLLAGPVGAAAGGAIGSATTMVFRKIGCDLSSRMLSPREQERVGGVYVLAAAEIVERCQNGEKVREDGFFGTRDLVRTDAEEVWESMLLKSQKEPEERKLPYMAHLLANLAFDTEINAAMAHQMTKMAESMTYRQLCILQLSAIKERYKLRQRSYEGQESFSKDLYQILYEYYDLSNRGLINFGDTLAATLLDVNPGDATPQALGVDIYYQMRLDLIPDNELAPIADQLR